MADDDVPQHVNFIDTSRYWYHDYKNNGGGGDGPQTMPGSDDEVNAAEDFDHRVAVGKAMRMSYISEKTSESQGQAAEYEGTKVLMKIRRIFRNINFNFLYIFIHFLHGFVHDLKSDIWQLYDVSSKGNKLPRIIRDWFRNKKDQAEKLACAGVQKRKNGTYRLPDFGISGYKYLVCALHLLPTKHDLAYHTVVLYLVMLLSFFRFSVAWLLFVFALVEGYQVYETAKRTICEAFDLTIQGRVNPAYILNPEVETVGFVNVLINRLWHSCFRGFIKKDVKKAFNLLMSIKEDEREGLSVFFNQWQPRILELDIGELVPKIVGVKSYSSAANATLLNSNDDDLSVDVGIQLHLQTRVMIALNENLSFGIHKLQLDSPMRFRFIPLLRDKKLFGQIHISFLTKPIIDYDFSGLLGVFSLAMIKPVVLYFAQEAIKYVIHPHKFVIPNPYVDNYKDHVLTPSKPLGLLRVKLMEGSRLKPHNMPICCVLVAQSDPYVVLELGPKSEKTPVIRKNRNPEWNHVCEFPITRLDEEFRELKLKVYDFKWGFWQDDDPLGFTTISVDEAVKRNKVDEWYRLGDGGNATLHVFIQYVQLEKETMKFYKSPAIPADPRVSQAILVILLYEVQMSQLCRPMMVFQVSGRPPATSTPGQLSENWEFAEEFIFPIHNARTDKVTISLVDYETRTSAAAASGRVFESMKDFIAEAEDPQPIQEYQREKHHVLSERTLDVEGTDGFSGFKQQINLESGEGGIFNVLLIGRLHYLKNQTYKEHVATQAGDGSVATQATSPVTNRVVTKK